MTLGFDIAMNLIGGRVVGRYPSSSSRSLSLLGNEFRDSNKYYPSLSDETLIGALQPSSNGNDSICADNVLHNKSSKICVERVCGKAKEVGLTYSSSSKKIIKKKKKKVGAAEIEGSSSNSGRGGKACHLTVERNRRKQMNENLAILRSLMPRFYLKRGDQASIIGGVIEYIVELQQILRSLEAKKHRELLFRKVIPSPKPPPTFSSSPASLLTPKSTTKLVLSVPFSPATPQPQKPQMNLTSSLDRVLIQSSPSNTYIENEFMARAKSTTAAVEVKFSGPHLVLKTVSRNIPGQAAKIIATLEELSLEALQVSINRVDETTMLKYFKIKIEFDCQLSAEEVAQRVLRTFHE